MNNRHCFFTIVIKYLQTIFQMFWELIHIKIFSKHFRCSDTVTPRIVVPLQLAIVAVAVDACKICLVFLPSFYLAFQFKISIWTCCPQIDGVLLDLFLLSALLWGGLYYCFIEDYSVYLSIYASSSYCFPLL